MKRYDIRHECNRLLFRGTLAPGTYIEMRCPKCNKMYVSDIPGHTEILSERAQQAQRLLDKIESANGAAKAEYVDQIIELAQGLTPE